MEVQVAHIETQPSTWDDFFCDFLTVLVDAIDSKLLPTAPMEDEDFVVLCEDLLEAIS
jgi:hypothetical protein